MKKIQYKRQILQFIRISGLYSISMIFFLSIAAGFLSMIFFLSIAAGFLSYPVHAAPKTVSMLETSTRPLTSTFDLALVMVTSVAETEVGDDVTFVIHIKNQGTTDASDIEIYNWLHAGFDFNETQSPIGWELVDGALTYKIPLLRSEESYELPLVLTVNEMAGSVLINAAEISRATDVTTGVMGVDIDSTMDGAVPDPQNDEVNDRLSPADLNINQEIGDEDDHDVAVVALGITLSPSLQMKAALLTPKIVAPYESVKIQVVISNTSSVNIHNLPLTYTHSAAYMAFVDAEPQPDQLPTLGKITWQDLTSTFGRALAPQEAFQITLNFVAQRDTTLEVAQTTAGVASMLFHENVETAVQISTPPMIAFESYSVKYADNVVLIKWHTAEEKEVAGFHIYTKQLDMEEETVSGEGAATAREAMVHNGPTTEQAVWSRITTHYIEAQATNRGPGAEPDAAYDFTQTDLPQKRRFQYMLEIISVNGLSAFVELGEVYTGHLLYLPHLMR